MTFLAGRSSFVKEPRVEQFSVYIVSAKRLHAAADIEFPPRCLKRALTVGLPNQPHDSAGVPVNGGMKAMAPFDLQASDTSKRARLATSQMTLFKGSLVDYLRSVP
jgi:hypothetical protein